MRLYLAGPMTGLPDLNFPAFHAHAARLRALGHVVISPAEACADIAGQWHACMRRDLQLLLHCEAIALLAGWENSRGARLEHHVATQLGIAVHLADDIIWTADRRDRQRRAPAADLQPHGQTAPSSDPRIARSQLPNGRRS